ncbi:hypothetical protein LTR85_001183 [Meristemomyces frigidus]|nr:hypothetical protein LTR85_001183 [Meristemomyces frigidus]
MLKQDASADIHAIFVFSIILIILAFASAQTEAEPPSLDAILDLFALIRGPRALAQNKWDAIKGSHIQALIGPIEGDKPPAIPEALREHLEQVVASNLDSPYREEFVKLKEGIYDSSQPFDIRVVGRWPSLMSDGFFALLKEHDSRALVILSQYSIILRAFHKRWWIGSWDRSLISAIDEAMPESDRKQMNWRIEELEHLLNLQD